MRFGFSLASVMILIVSAAHADTYSCSFKPVTRDGITPKSLTVAIDRSTWTADIEDALIDGAETARVVGEATQVSEKRVAIIWKSHGYILTTGNIAYNVSRGFPLVNYQLQIRPPTERATIRAFALNIANGRHDYATSGQCKRIN